MPSVLIIEKNTDIRILTIKNYVESELYKKCGFKSNDHFENITSWSTNNSAENATRIFLFGKSEGRANYENKYEFPPPADKVLLFGSCVLVKKTADETVLDLTEKEWLDFYNKLHGGFEDCNGGAESDDDDLASQEDEAEHAHLARTKQGYIKDDFVVDDDEDLDEDYEPDEKPKKKSKAKKEKKPKAEKRKPLRKTKETIAQPEETAAPPSDETSNTKKKPRKKAPSKKKDQTAIIDPENDVKEAIISEIVDEMANKKDNNEFVETPELNEEEYV